MNREIKVGIHNCFDFVRRDAKTGEILGKYKAENIILDNFWGTYLSSNALNCLKYIHFGSGTATPVATDIKLTTWLGYKTAPVYNNASTIYDFSNFHATGVASVKKTIRLDDTEFVGSFISEVGYSSVTSGTTGLLTKALVKDMNGNAVSIEKKAGEVLDIFATFYVSFGTSFDSGNIAFSASAMDEYALIYQMLFYKSSQPWRIIYQSRYLQGHPQPQSGGEKAYVNSYGVVPTASFDVPNRKLIYTVPNLVSASGNIEGGIRGMTLGGLGIKLPCTGFSQPILTKEVVGTGDGTTKDFQTKFGYIKNNGTAKVYVNDVEVSATIDYDQMYPKTNIANDVIIVDYSKSTTQALEESVLIGADAFAVTSLDNYVIVENPFYSKVPITSIAGGYFTAYGSNDLTNWTQIAQTLTSGATVNVSIGNQNFQYIKFQMSTNTKFKISAINTTANIKNIHLTSAPSMGDTVAVTYQPDCIAKDDQHVLNNVKVTLSFNEYTPT